MSTSWFIWVCDCPQKIHADPEYDGPVECFACKGEVREIEVAALAANSQFVSAGTVSLRPKADR